MRKFTVYLGKIDGYGNGVRNCPVEIEVELRKQSGVHTTIDLKEIVCPIELSIVGAAWNHIHTNWLFGGQCYDTIMEYFPGDPLVAEIVEVWRYWHLNAMVAGTRKQEHYLATYEGERTGDYTDDCEILRRAGLLKDQWYTYGTAWLVEPLPDDVIEQVLSWEEQT